MSRIDRPIGFLQKQRSAPSPSPYLCRACKHQTTFISTSSKRAAPTRGKSPFTERLRQKIWGTDNPPGQDDPYGDGSVFDKTKKPKQTIELRQQETYEARMNDEEAVARDLENETNTTTSTGSSKRAKSWDGLQWVGGGPVWRPEEDFEGFLPANAATEPGEFAAALHRAVVEVFALEQTGKSLHTLSTQFPEIDVFRDWTDDVQIIPSSGGATIKMPENTSLEQVLEVSAIAEATEGVAEVDPTESQEDIMADRTKVDPLNPGAVSSTDSIPETKVGVEFKTTGATHQASKEILEHRTFEDVIASWDPSWLQISLDNPEIKFAVRHVSLGTTIY